MARHSAGSSTTLPRRTSSTTCALLRAKEKEASRKEEEPRQAEDAEIDVLLDQGSPQALQSSATRMRRTGSATKRAAPSSTSLNQKLIDRRRLPRPARAAVKERKGSPPWPHRNKLRDNRSRRPPLWLFGCIRLKRRQLALTRSLSPSDGRTPPRVVAERPRAGGPALAENHRQPLGLSTAAPPRLSTRRRWQQRRRRR